MLHGSQFGAMLTAVVIALVKFVVVETSTLASLLKMPVLLPNRCAIYAQPRRCVGGGEKRCWKAARAAVASFFASVTTPAPHLSGARVKPPRLARGDGDLVSPWGSR